MPPRIEQVHDEAVEQYFSRKSKEEPKKKEVSKMQATSGSWCTQLPKQCSVSLLLLGEPICNNYFNVSCEPYLYLSLLYYQFQNSWTHLLNVNCEGDTFVIFSCHSVNWMWNCFHFCNLQWFCTESENLQCLPSIFDN